MRPSVRQTIEGIASSLRTRIAPLVAEDEWAASELRSIDALLAHLAVRVEQEAACLRADNADAREVLLRLVADVDGLGELVAPLLEEADRPDADADAATTEALHADNVIYRTAIERVLHALHERGHPELASVRAYLVRSVEREREIYGPLTAGPLF